jgi:hypothetical protein
VIARGFGLVGWWRLLGGCGNTGQIYLHDLGRHLCRDPGPCTGVFENFRTRVDAFWRLWICKADRNIESFDNTKRRENKFARGRTVCGGNVEINKLWMTIERDFLRHREKKT